MAAETVTGGMREMAVVLTLALSGVTLAAVVAFTPWYGVAERTHSPDVTEMHAPAPLDADARSGAVPGGRSVSHPSLAFGATGYW